MNTMTREEILTMKPGRVLDMRVAQFVIGGSWIDDVPDFSTRLSAAWEVVEKFPIIKITRVEIFEGNYYHAVEISANTETDSPLRVEAKTAPEAICKAALLAVLGEEEAK